MELLKEQAGDGAEDIAGMFPPDNTEEDGEDQDGDD